MAFAYPDVIGEYIDSPERFEINGVQLAGYFEPTQIAPEQISHLYLFLQNTLNVPLAISLKADLPQTGGLFGGGRLMLKVAEPILQLQLGSAEVGLLTWPVTTTQNVKTGEVSFNIELKVAGETRGGQRIRPAQSQSKLDKSLIDSPVGLNLVSTLGATYTAKQAKKASIPLKIEGAPNPPERAPRLNHSYETIWVTEHAQTFNQAIQEINSRQVNFKNELTDEALFTQLYAESVSRFADVGLPLRIGEAITLAKILTYSCRYFLNHPDHYSGLMVPIWERALTDGVNTTHALEVIRSVGYQHLLKLALALSFGIIAQALGRQYWPLHERQAVINYVADNIETGQSLDPEFLYLPLLIAGTYISKQVKLSGEDVQHSLALMKKARETRRGLFLDEDMAQANQVCNQIFKKVLA
jgi:hypothetical protein